MTALLHRPPLTVSASAAQGSPTPCDLHHIASTRTHRVSPVLPVCGASPLLSPPPPLSVFVLLTAGTRRTPLGGHMLHPYAFLQPPHSKPPFIFVKSFETYMNENTITSREKSREG